MSENKLSRVARIDNGFFSDDDPLAELARIVGQDNSRAQVAPQAAQRREPEFDLEDELLREFERFDAPFRDAARAVMQPANRSEPAFVAPVEPVAAFRPEPVAAAPEAVVRSFVPEQPAVAAVPAAIIPSAPEPEADVVFQAPAFDMSDFGLDDSSEAVDDPFFAELANVAAPVPAPKPVVAQPLNIAPSEPVSAFAEWKTDRLAGVPIQHEAAAPVYRPEPIAVPDENLDDALQAELPVHEPAAPVAEAAFQPQPAYTVATPQSRQTTSGLTDMLADVERFPIPARNAVPAPKVEPVARPSLATPTLQQNSGYTAPIAAFSQPVAAKPVQPTPAINLEETPADPFEHSDFQFDLDSIEQELSDVSAAPSVEQNHPAGRSGWDSTSNAKSGERTLHFDPSQIAESDDHPEAIAHLEVPTLPVIEKDDHKPATPDYYMEIDTEMGNLFSDDMAGSKSGPRPSATHGGGASSQVPFETKLDRHLEEFERELEEDFRQSLLDGEPMNVRERVMSGHARAAAADDYENELEDGRRRGGFLIAAALTGLFVLGGAGYYLWNHTGLSTIATSGEPRIILADKEPSKVVPEDKGGQTVPNQDKAVYDKVAGANTETPKQKSLISSSESPVDVVQKTLAPETTEGQQVDPVADQTATADTQDSRLLPDAQETASANGGITPATEAPSIAPRKVKTMIVRSDGTLVQRPEDPAQDTAASAPTAPASTSTVASAANADAASKVSEEALPSAANATDPSKKNDARVPAAGSATTIADAASATVPVTVPAHKVKSTTTGSTPVPAARPSDQPVNVVGTVTDKGNVVADAAPSQPAKASQTAKPVEVAAADPAPQPAAASTTSSGTFGMQIASLPSEDEANRSFASLQKKFGGVLSGRSFEIRKADIAGKGTYYRVRIPVGSKDEAAALCEKYRAAGGSCLVSK